MIELHIAVRMVRINVGIVWVSVSGDIDVRHIDVHRIDVDLDVMNVDVVDMAIRRVGVGEGVLHLHIGPV
jgi:hypothetical protein